MSTFDLSILDPELARLERLFAPPRPRLFRFHLRCGLEAQVYEHRAPTRAEAEAVIVACRPGWTVDRVTERPGADGRPC